MATDLDRVTTLGTRMFVPVIQGLNVRRTTPLAIRSAARDTSNYLTSEPDPNCPAELVFALQEIQCPDLTLFFHPDYGFIVCAPSGYVTTRPYPYVTTEQPISPTHEPVGIQVYGYQIENLLPAHVPSASIEQTLFDSEYTADSENILPAHAADAEIVQTFFPVSTNQGPDNILPGHQANAEIVQTFFPITHVQPNDDNLLPEHQVSSIDYS